MLASKPKKVKAGKRSVSATSKKSNMAVISSSENDPEVKKRKQNSHSKTLPLEDKVSSTNKVNGNGTQNAAVKTKRSLRSNKTLPLVMPSENDSERMETDSLKENVEDSPTKSTSSMSDSEFVRPVNGRVPANNRSKQSNGTISELNNNDSSKKTASASSSEFVRPLNGYLPLQSVLRTKKPVDVVDADACSVASTSTQDTLSNYPVTKELYNARVSDIRLHRVWWQQKIKVAEQTFADAPGDEGFEGTVESSMQEFNAEMDVRLRKLQDVNARFHQSLQDIRVKYKRLEKQQARQSTANSQQQQPTDQLEEGLIEFSTLRIEDGVPPPVPKDGVVCFKNFLSAHRFRAIKDKYKKRQQDTADKS